MSDADSILAYSTPATAPRHRFSFFNWISLSGGAVALLGALWAHGAGLHSTAARSLLFGGVVLIVSGLIVELIRCREVVDPSDLPPIIPNALAAVVGDPDEPCTIAIAETCDKTAASFIERRILARGMMVIRREAMLPDARGRRRLRGVAILVRPADAAVGHEIAESVLHRRARVRTIVTPLRGNGPSLFVWPDEKSS